MLKVQTKDGATVHVDLSDAAQARDVIRRLKSPSHQAELTALTVAQPIRERHRCPSCGFSSQTEGKHVHYALARPEGFHSVFLWPEIVEPDGRVKGGEKITAIVDDFRLTLMVHRSQPAIRVSLLKTGRQRYNPLVDE